MINTAILASRLTAHTCEGHEWFAVYTGSCQEKRVSAHCQVRELESFLPTYQTVRRWRNGCTVQATRPLFPGYVFVKFNPAERVRVLELPGVVSIVGAARRPTPLPETDIEVLRNGIGMVNAEPHDYLNVGEFAKISAGPLTGMTGVVVRKKNNLRVVLSLELIMKSISVEVDSHDLEVISKPPVLPELSPAALVF